MTNGGRRPARAKASTTASPSGGGEDELVVLSTAQGVRRVSPRADRDAVELEPDPRGVGQVPEIGGQAVGDVDHGVGPRQPGDLTLGQARPRATVSLHRVGLPLVTGGPCR